MTKKDSAREALGGKQEQIIDPISRRRFLETLGGAALIPPLHALMADAAEVPSGPASGQKHEFVIATRGISRIFGLDPAGGLVLKSLKNPDTGHQWVVPRHADFAFTSSQFSFQGLTPASGFHFAGVRNQAPGNGRKELRLDFIHPASRLRLSLFYASFFDTSVIEQWCRLENTGTQTIAGVSRFDPFFLVLRGRPAEFRVHAFRRDECAVESWPIEEKLEIISPQHIGFLSITNPAAQESLFLGVRWERDWAVRFNNAGDLQVSAGLINFSHDLAPGGVIESPKIFLGLAHGDPDATTRAFHDYLWKYVLPAPIKDEPWVVYDIYTTEDNNNVEKTLLDEIDFAAELGIENFYYDASWYEGSSGRGTGDWGAGLGHYRVDSKKFPRGLGYVSSYAHSRGLKFGLWVDPAVVDSRMIPNEIPRRWAAQSDGKDIELTVHYKNEDWAPLAKLCLGNPEVVTYLKDHLNRLITDLHLDWVKWDNSGRGNKPCTRTDHGHQTGDGSYAAMRGEYEIWDYLHKNHPNLILEVCGPSQDFGKAPYCRANWLSDSTFPSLHARGNVMNASYLFPSSYNSTYILREPEAMGQTDPALLDTIYRSRMMGRFGFGSYEVLSDRVSKFPPAVIEAGRRNIPIYKKYRHLLAQDSYHLTPPCGSPEGWQAMEFCNREGSEAVVIAFRNASMQSAYQFPLKGMRGTARYTVKSVNSGTSSIRSGADLARDGVFIALPKGQMSEILLLTLA